MAIYISHEDEDTDPLGPARGAIVGILIGILFWVVVGLAVIG